MQQTQTTCKECKGEGRIISPQDRCRVCSGRKINKERKILEVHIDKGMVDGQKIIFNGEGDQEPGLAPGDIIIVLEEVEHPVFKRSGLDLIIKQELELVESLCGFQRVIKTLDNRELVITAIPGEVTKHNTVRCVQNEGMPQYKNPFEKGRLIIQFSVKFPDKINPQMVVKLENCLPPRPQIMITDAAEEVALEAFNPEEESRNRRQRQFFTHNSYDEDDGPSGNSVNCATS